MISQRCIYLGVVLCLGFSSPVAGEQAAETSKATLKPEIMATETSFDVKTGRIEYTLPEPALVRIRIGLRTRAVLVNLIDWERREAGKNTEIWDKKDASGKIEYGQRDDFILIISCLPADKEELKNYQSTIKGYRKSPEFAITFPGSEVKDGYAQIKHMDPVRVTIKKEDQKWLTETKYELGLFINNAFLVEDEEGINPFTYRLNTKGLREGIHTITVNVVGYEGEIGTKSVLVKILK